MAAPQTPIVSHRLDDLEVAPKGWEWRPGQQELAERIAASPKKIIMLEAECGTGKSLIPLAAAAATGSEVLVLIQTIQLQEQYLRDFRKSFMLTGRSHYICNKTDRPADRAPCTIGVRCSMKGQWDFLTGQPLDTPECNYFRAKARARRSPISVQNYAYWLGETSTGRSVFAKQKTIICDEAHDLDQILMNAATLEITLPKLHLVGMELPDDPASLESWMEWPRVAIPLLNSTIASEEARLTGMGFDLGRREEFLPEEDQDFEPPATPTEDIGTFNRFEAETELYREAKKMLDLAATIRRDVNLDDWVLDAHTRKNGSRVWLIKPIYGKYGFRRILAAASEKVILMSAFLAPQMLIRTLDLNPDDVEIIEAPRTFDRRLSPVLFCPTVKLSFKTSEQEMKFVIATMDDLIDFYSPRKGIVHVPSVGLRDLILRNSKHRNSMVTYEGAGSRRDAVGLTKDQALEEFRRPGFKILLGQSVSTGVDLPYVPEWQIIPKLWFAPTNDPAIAARKDRDKDFYPYHTICQIVQAVGRVKRAPDHNGPTVILDDQFRWFWARNREFFPAWFKDAFVWDGWKRFPSTYNKLDSLALRSGFLRPKALPTSATYDKRRK